MERFVHWLKNCRGVGSWWSLGVQHLSPSFRTEENMDPGPWTALWTWSMDHPKDPVYGPPDWLTPNFWGQILKYGTGMQIVDCWLGITHDIFFSHVSPLTSIFWNPQHTNFLSYVLVCKKKKKCHELLSIPCFLFLVTVNALQAWTLNFNYSSNCSFFNFIIWLLKVILRTLNFDIS